MSIVPAVVPTKNISMYEKDDFSEAVTFVNAAGATLDVSAWTWTAPQLRNTAVAVGSSLIATMTLDTTNAAGGVVLIKLAKASCTGFTTASFDLRGADAAGLIHTVGRWYVTLEPQITVLS